MYLKSILSDWYWRLDRYIQDLGLGLRIRNWEFVNKNYSLIFETEDGDFYVTASPIYKQVIYVCLSISRLSTFFNFQKRFREYLITFFRIFQKRVRDLVTHFFQFFKILEFLKKIQNFNKINDGPIAELKCNY